MFLDGSVLSLFSELYAELKIRHLSRADYVNRLVVGSSPTNPTILGIVAQQVEHLTFNQRVAGSIPASSTILSVPWSNGNSRGFDPHVPRSNRGGTTIVSTPNAKAVGLLRFIDATHAAASPHFCFSSDDAPSPDKILIPSASMFNAAL